MRAWIVLPFVLACGAPKWTEGSELVVRERAVDRIGVIWDDADNASSYVATIDGRDPQEIRAPSVEAIFEGLDEAHLYLIEVRAQNMFGETEPLRAQARTRDGTPPVFPDGAELSYELSNAAQFSWPEASDASGVIEYVLRDADEPETELEHVRETQVLHDEPPPRRVEVIARDAEGNESEPLRVELSEDESSEFEARRLEFHREIAEDFELSDAMSGDMPEGINQALLRELVEQRDQPEVSAPTPERSAP